MILRESEKNEESMSKLHLQEQEPKSFVPKRKDRMSRKYPCKHAKRYFYKEKIVVTNKEGVQVLKTKRAYAR